MVTHNADIHRKHTEELAKFWWQGSKVCAKATRREALLGGDKIEWYRG